MGPASKRACQNCGKHVGVPWLPILLLLVASSVVPIIVAFAFVNQFAPFSSVATVGLAFVAGLLFGNVVVLWLAQRLVPLIPRSS